MALDERAHLRLLHYLWPVLMGASIVLVVRRATARPIDPAGFALLISGTLAAYSLDRILDRPRIPLPTWLQTTLIVVASIGVAASMLLLTAVPLHTAMLVPPLGLLVLAYPRLKALPMVKTLLVSTAWTWSAIALPFPDGSWLGWRAWSQPVAIPLLLIIASSCVLCDLKDVRADRAARVRSLPVLMGQRGSLASAMLLALSGVAVALTQHRTGLVVGGLVLGCASLRPSLLERDALGPLLVDMILTIPGALIALHLV